MAHIYFECRNDDQALLPCCETEVEDLGEARDAAAGVIRSLLASPGPQDWRDWVLYATDDLGEVIFDVPFAKLVGKPH